MWNIILLAIIIIVVLVYKGRITDFFGNIKRNTKVTYRPKYRTYNDMVNVSEHVQYEVIPEFGITADIIRDNYNDVMEMMLKDKHEDVALNQIADVYRRTVDKSFAHYYLYELFFTQISKTSKDKYPLHEVMVAIKFGL